MSIIIKSNTGFKPFKWLRFNLLTDSKGYKFELYLTKEEPSTQDLIDIFHKLFSPFIKELEISTPIPGLAPWGDYCLDTWNMHQESSNYSIEGKSPTTQRYLKMLQDNHIEPSYVGLCLCHNWNEFLSITVDCVMACNAIYSIKCYCPSQKFMFYFHYTGSLGIYYKKFNDAVLYILTQAKAEKLDLYNWNDPNTITLLKGGYSNN